MRAQNLRRGWIIATISTSAAVLSHALAGGNYPPLILWALCTSLAAIVCVGLAGVKMPRLALAVSISVAQGIFHCLYSLSGGVVLEKATGGVHLQHAHVADAMVNHQHSESPLMLALHALAALATYILVRRADAIVAGLKALANNPWRRIFTLGELPALPQCVKALQSQVVLSLTGLLLRFCGLLRGPPLAVN